MMCLERHDISMASPTKRPLQDILTDASSPTTAGGTKNPVKFTNKQQSNIGRRIHKLHRELTVKAADGSVHDDDCDWTAFQELAGDLMASSPMDEHSTYPDSREMQFYFDAL